MPTANEGSSPSYISHQNANVYVSEARQMKLKAEAHRAINAFLDEFLYKILSASRSLTTDRLRAGLLTVLPTAVGKEAITEAEVELRAFLSSKPKGQPEDDKDTFHLQWSFELLRQKCRGYCTMSDADEDVDIQARVNEKMVATGATAPKETLLEPAGLYLAAILECTCHHILANVGRVASRDSSRMDATPADLFVALCEDNGIYALFKSMNVYEQIELLSKPRRSKSFSRSDKNSISRTSTSHQDTDSSSTPPPTRLSAEVSNVTSTTSTALTSRSSIDKSRGMKKFIGSRTSSDYGEGHKRSDSLISEDTYNGQYEDSSLQEFDDLMRSDSTLKVSLTPDRLKTMEVYKQEKDRANRRPTPLQVGKQEPDLSARSSPANGRRPSLRNESIVEDDEEPAKSLSGSRKGSISSSAPFPPSSTNRARSFSNSQPSPRSVRKSTSKSNVASPPSSFTSPMATQDFRGPPKGFDSDPFPRKTRKVQRNRESIDLDDVMAGSDDEVMEEPPKSSVTSPQPKRTVKVSQSTRELMSFLDEGPPDSTSAPHVSQSSRDLMDFLADGPPDMGYNAAVDGGKKGSGRLQRMMSKLSLGGSEKGRQGTEDLNRSGSRRPPTTPIKASASLSAKTSATNLSALANRPVPPRPPPISPPSSPSSEEQAGLTLAVNGRPPVLSREQNGHSTPKQKGDVTQPSAMHSRSTTSEEVLSPSRVRTVQDPSAKAVPDPIVVKRPITKSLPSSAARGAVSHSADATSSHTTRIDAQELRRLMANGGTAEECRLVLDMFLARSGVPVDATDYDVPYPSPSPSDKAEKSSHPSDAALENLVVELLLSGDVSIEPSLRKKRHLTTRKKVPTSPSNGSAPVAQNTIIPEVTANA